MRARTPVLLGVVLLLAACGSDSDDTAPATAPSETIEAPSDTAAPAVPDDPVATEPPTDTEAPDATDAVTADPPVVEALDLTAPVVGGGELDLAAFSGQPVALWFWAPT